MVQRTENPYRYMPGSGGETYSGTIDSSTECLYNTAYLENFTEVE
jgi:hypothetical protein